MQTSRPAALTFLGVISQDALDRSPRYDIFGEIDEAVSFPFLLKRSHELDVVRGGPPHAQRDAARSVVLVSQQRFQRKLLRERDALKRGTTRAARGVATRTYPPFAVPVVQRAGVDVEGAQPVVGADGIVVLHFEDHAFLGLEEF